MPGRSFSAGDYRFGFNGQESDDEVSGLKNSLTATFWQYSPRLGVRWNVDPKPNPSISPYSTFMSNPILNIDVAGDTTWTYSYNKESNKWSTTRIDDSFENQEHFIESGLSQELQEQFLQESDPNKQASLIRNNSDYFIGANTRNDLKNIASSAESANLESQYYFYHTKDNKELRAIDVSNFDGFTRNSNFVKSDYIAHQEAKNKIAKEYGAVVTFNGHYHGTFSVFGNYTGSSDQLRSLATPTPPFNGLMNDFDARTNLRDNTSRVMMVSSPSGYLLHSSIIGTKSDGYFKRPDFQQNFSRDYNGNTFLKNLK